MGATLGTHIPSKYDSGCLPEDMGKLGPAMRALNPRQRGFVDYVVTTGTSNECEAARAAGYMVDSDQALRQQANYLSRNPRIIAAIREEVERRLHFHLGLGARILIEAAEGRATKIQLDAANRLLDQGGLGVVRKSEVDHRHHLSIEELRERLAQLRGSPPPMLDITPDGSGETP